MWRRVARCAPAVAVRLDIRPRLRLAPDWQPGPVARRRFRLPALAVPAVAYWAAMAALTYAFTQLGPHPLDGLTAEPSAPVAPLPRPPAPRVPEPEPPADMGPSAEATPAATPPPMAAAEPLEAPVVEERPPPAPSRQEVDATDAPARREARLEPSLGLPADPPSARLSFPEFTDSAPARPRERAADGPRVDSLFERADTGDHRAPEAAPGDAPAERAPSAPVALLSCEAAIARNDERLEIGGPRGPADITREGYASILQNGSYLSGCSLPDRTVIEICAAVKHGRAVGVTVTSAPANASLAACVRRAVSRLNFPQSERLDVTHTRFDAARR
ncbi:MAG: uncharacterized protein K0R38_3151 [Polyangiaceae bacterium]|nr:uncharacterized protein [Polyangiaceae bacterium]